MPCTSDELARLVGATIVGSGAAKITHVASLERAEPGAVSFVTHSKYLKELAQCNATAVILREEWVASNPAISIVSKNPYLDYAKVAAFLHPRKSALPGIHPSASVAESVAIAKGVAVGANVSIENNAVIGAGVEIGAGSRIGSGVLIGSNTVLKQNVVVDDDCEIGESCLIQAGAIIGSDGFGYTRDGAQWLAIRQLGCVKIGDRVHIGANTTIDRGAMDNTIIGDGVILDNQIQVAHNVIIGEDSAIAGCVGIAGSAKIGKRCTIGGAATVLGHLELCDDVHINAMSLVTASIKSPGNYSSSTPVDEAGKWRKNFSRFRNLDSFVKRLRALEKKFKN